MNNPYHLKPEKTEEISIEGGSVLLNSGGSPVLLEAEFKRSIWHPGEAWIEMDDDLLSMWYERIFSGIITNFELPINLDITKQKS